MGLKGFCVSKKRGLAIGAYNTATGAAYLPASMLLGALWASFGAFAAFATSAAIAITASILLAKSRTA